MDLVWYRHVKFRPWCVPLSRQMDLSDGLLFEPFLGLLFGHLGCGRAIFLWPSVPSSILWGCNKCPQSEHKASYLPPSRSARYSNSPISLLHAEATGSESCPVVLQSNRRLVGPASTPEAKRMAVFSSRRQSSIDFCATSIMVWARGPDIL